MNSAALELRPAPPLLVSAGLLLWGWQNHFLPYALFMALLLETAHRVNWRWPITEREFNLLTDISGVGFFIAILYIFNDKGAGGIYTILSILPFVLFLLVLTQEYSQRGRVRVSALFISLRRYEASNPAAPRREIDLSLPYFIICLLAASAGNQRGSWFFPACCLLLGVLMWLLRPQRFHAGAWLALFLSAAAIAYAGQLGIRNLQALIEQEFMGMFDQFMWRYRDPDRTTTAIGMIGRLKFSDRILIRIRTDSPLDQTLYLREASYNRYSYGVWSAGTTSFSLIDPSADGTRWVLNQTEPQRDAEISTYMVRDKGVIPLPMGTSQISGTGIVQINQNPYGAVTLESRAGWFSYHARYRNGALDDTAPEPDDLEITSSYRADFERLARELQLTGQPPAAVITAVERFFSGNFTYSLEGRRRFPRGRYLHDFLYNSRRGHCEYFATATVLLLRAAGVPARYVVGYATREYSSLEHQYVARSRHAHSWVIAYVDNRWRLVDTTPAVWAPLEDDTASPLQPLFDLYSWLRYRYEKWQSGKLLDEQSGDGNFDLLWLLLPLLAILGWRLYFKERVQRSRHREAASGASWPGLDSGFYALMDCLEQRGFRRRSAETPRTWLARVETDASVTGLRTALEYHYRYRFDPAGLSAEARREFARSIEQAWSALRART